MLPRLDLTGVDVGKINASPDHQVGVHSMLLYQKKKKKKKKSKHKNLFLVCSPTSHSKI